MLKKDKKQKNIKAYKNWKMFTYTFKTNTFEKQMN